MLLFLAHLEAGQVGVPQNQLVLVFEVLRHRAFNRLAVLLLQGESARGDDTEEILTQANMGPPVCSVS